MTTVKPYENPSILITQGPFKISRHPMYLGMIVILSGMVIVLGSISTIIFPVIFVLMMEILFIPFEEKLLEKEFKNDYLFYKQKVRRWV
jgi:protein-S-isoprenylcysteine O-methyltransferase Ste14